MISVCSFNSLVDVFVFYDVLTKYQGIKNFLTPLLSYFLRYHGS